MGKKEYLEFLIPLLKSVDWKKTIDGPFIDELGEKLNCRETELYVNMVEIYPNELINPEIDIPKNLYKVFGIMIIGSKYKLVQFFGNAGARTFYSHI